MTQGSLVFTLVILLSFSFLIPFPGKNKEIDSKILVLPEPFGPIKIFNDRFFNI